jgi:hypothetical protein
MGRRQIHFWLGESEYAFLQHSAQEADEPVGAFLRRLIRLERLRAESKESRVGNSTQDLDAVDLRRR